jgi:hypothetical protein
MVYRRYANNNTIITALRTAVDNDGVLDKEATSYNDIFDAFRLALSFIIMKKEAAIIISSFLLL